MTKLWHQYRIILVFYRGFVIPAVIITIFCCAGMLEASLEQIRAHEPFYGILTFLAPFFVIKSLTSVLIILYLVSFKSNEMYFYFNLGIGKTALWIATFVMDYLLFFWCIWLTSLILSIVTR